MDCHASFHSARNDDLNKLCNDRKKSVITRAKPEVIDYKENSILCGLLRSFQSLAMTTQRETGRKGFPAGTQSENLLVIRNLDAKKHDNNVAFPKGTQREPIVLTIQRNAKL